MCGGSVNVSRKVVITFKGEDKERHLTTSKPFRTDYKVYIYGHNYKMEETEEKI
jgi:hypothetical protein